MNNFFTNSRAKTFLLFLVFALFSQVQIFAQKKNEPPKAETKTPAVGKVTQIDDAKLKEIIKPNGKPLLVNFWATWCDPCREEFPDLVKLENDYRGKIDVITISLDDLAEINTTVPKFLSEMKAEMPNYLLVSKDEGAIISTISKDWSGGLPFTILYNEKGETIYFKQGKFKVPELRSKIEGAFGNQSNFEKGRIDALNDAQAGKFIFKTAFSYNKRIFEAFETEYGIKLETIAKLQTKEFLKYVISNEDAEYAAGYNQVAENEIKKKFGEQVSKLLVDVHSINHPANVVKLTIEKK